MHIYPYIPTHTHAHMHAHTHAHTHTHTHTHLPVSVSSLVLIALPKDTIFGLPFTATKMAQTDLNASTVHFSFKYLWRIWFCTVGSSALAMVLWSPLLIISLWRSSMITFSASTSLMNRSRNWSNTCSAAWEGKTHGTLTSQHLTHSIAYTHL